MLFAGAVLLEGDGGGKGSNFFHRARGSRLEGELWVDLTDGAKTPGKAL
jgi:hypothetical protein